MTQIVRITVAPEDSFYLIHFPDYPELFTQATHPREIEKMARDLYGLVYEVPIEDIEIQITAEATQFSL